MAYLGDGEKFIIGIVVVALIILGMMTVFSQINYGSPLMVFSSNVQPRRQTKTKSQDQPRTEKQPIIQARTATVKQDLNFRPAPNTNNTPYYVLRSGARVNVISVQNGWARITDSSGREGYVDNSFLRY